MKTNPIVYLLNGSSWSSSYIPDTFEGCKEYFLKTLDMLVASVIKYRETNIGIPKFLVLNDSVANNILWEYMYSYEKELSAKLADNGLLNINVFHCLTAQKAITVVEKICKEFPNYSFSELNSNINSLLPYMESNYGQEDYAIYTLSKSQNESETSSSMSEEINNEERSSLWEDYFDLLKRANGKEIGYPPHFVKLPKEYEGKKYSVILTTGEIIEAELVFFGNLYQGQTERLGFYWKISEDDLRDAHFYLAAWKRIN